MKNSVVVGNRIASDKKALAKKFKKESTVKEKEVWEWLTTQPKRPRIDIVLPLSIHGEGAGG